MNKPIAMLVFVIAGHFSLAHAEADPYKTSTLFVADEAEPARSISMLPGDEAEGVKCLPMRIEVADHDSRLHPTLTDDSGEFQIDLRPNHSLVEVDFSSVVGQTAPLLVEGNNFAVSLSGNAQVVTSYQGFPATYWFGDQAEPSFVLVGGTVQIVFSQDVSAVSLAVDGDVMQYLTEQVMLLDVNGDMVGQASFHTTTDGPNTLNVPSNIPFRSVIISNTAETWMFSDLNYAVDQERPMLQEGNVGERGMVGQSGI